MTGRSKASRLRTTSRGCFWAKGGELRLVTNAEAQKQRQADAVLPHTELWSDSRAAACALSSATVWPDTRENGQGQTDCKSQLLYSAGCSYLETAVEPPSGHTELTAAHSHGDAFILQKQLSRASQAACKP